MKILKTEALKRINTAQILVDKSVSDNTLLFSLTKELILSVRVKEKIEKSEIFNNCS